jgi:glutamate carboxypeptidase
VAESQRPVLAAIERFLAALGYAAEYLPGRQSGGQLLARPTGANSTGASQLLLGHCDTVWPLGTLAEMPVTVEDGRVHGPGVFDMKGGLAMSLFALKALHDLGLAPSVTPIVLITTDEEVGSFESRPRIEQLAGTVDRVYVPEPALGPEGWLKTARKGVGEFEVVVRGRAAHAGLDPEAGASAILEASYVVQHLFELNEPDRGITVNVGTMDGGLRTNVVAPLCRLTVDVRVPDESDVRRIDAAIRSLAPTTPGVTLDVRGGIDRLPMARTPRNRALWEAAVRLGRSLGLSLEEGTAGGGSDGNFTSPHTATLDGLGAVGAGAHAAHEHLEIDRSLERCALLALLLMEPPL